MNNNNNNKQYGAIAQQIRNEEDKAETALLASLEEQRSSLPPDPFDNNRSLLDSDTTTTTAPAKKQNFATIAKKVMRLNQVNHHRRNSKSSNIAQDLLSTIQEENGIFQTESESNNAENNTTNTNRLVEGAMQVEQLFQNQEQQQQQQQEDQQQYDIDDNEERLPLKQLHSKRRQNHHYNNNNSYSCCNPLKLGQGLWTNVVRQSYFVTMAIPLFVLSIIFFYSLGNPSPDFLPGQASIAWWLNFMGRQCITLELARILQFILLDSLLLGTRLAVQSLGPYLTLLAISSKGWPCIAFLWSIIDMFALHGEGEFQRHWLYFTGIKVYVQANSGSYVLTSQIYMRLLVAVMLAGIATAIKRTFVATYFGRRMLYEFKPKLEKILQDTVILAEIAELSQETTVYNVTPDPKLRKMYNDVNWNATRSRLESMGDEDDSDDESEDANSAYNKEQDFDWRKDALTRTDNGSLRIRQYLDYWDEPVNKLDKSSKPSIHDVLRFRRALTFMDESSPFGDAFGPASTRDEVLMSSVGVFQRLMRLSNRVDDKLSIEVLEMLAEEDDGSVNYKKKKTISRLFRPDANRQLSLVAFVQYCDNLYKKLRYFRASVGNASVIDHVLENIIDSIFHFVLLLFLLSIMRFNPWPLLVSISTILVSISFAVGSSASKYIEGVLLIALRRPFDLGDRIYMQDPSTVDNDGLFMTWFVEDINLFTSVVRYAGTNEIATINNGSIASMRIVNGNRSPNAIVWFQFPYHIRLLQDGRMDTLREALQKYASDFPRRWHSFSYCRVDEVHPDKEKLVVTIGFQHRSSWQDLAKILFHKQDLMCFVEEYGRKQGINYEDLPTRNIMYFGGDLKKGGVSEYRMDLHKAENLSNESTGLLHRQLPPLHS